MRTAMIGGGQSDDAITNANVPLSADGHYNGSFVKATRQAGFDDIVFYDGEPCIKTASAALSSSSSSSTSTSSSTWTSSTTSGSTSGSTRSSSTSGSSSGSSRRQHPVPDPALHPGVVHHRVVRFRVVLDPVPAAGLTSTSTSTSNRALLALPSSAAVPGSG